ncbi:MAG TPA: hypothetical protein VJ963_00805 [Bacteroidales bacterium]|nr:hypothetical protein [Bacteroidales bacterium]
MKKILSISFALLILLSGMNISISNHFCHHKLSASEISFSGKTASCGMETDLAGDNPANGSLFDSGCCSTNLSKLIVDNNYSPSSFDFKYFGHLLLQVLAIPESLTNYSYSALNAFHTTDLPPGILNATNVSLPDICVFRI